MQVVPSNESFTITKNRRRTTARDAGWSGCPYDQYPKFGQYITIVSKPIASPLQHLYVYFFWFFAVMVAYYLFTFVISLSCYPLARYTTIPAVIFLCFSGVGVSYLLDRYFTQAKRRLASLFIAATILIPIALGFFSHPSENAIAEKLRAISPLTNPPTYYFDFVADCRKTLADGSRLLLDTRNYNHRLLYLDLYEYHNQIDYYWPSTDSLLGFIERTHPPLLVRTDLPRPDKPIFDTANGSVSITAGGVKYHLLARQGIYCLYATQ